MAAPTGGTRSRKRFGTPSFRGQVSPGPLLANGPSAVDSECTVTGGVRTSMARIPSETRQASSPPGAKPRPPISTPLFILSSHESRTQYFTYPSAAARTPAALNGQTAVITGRTTRQHSKSSTRGRSAFSGSSTRYRLRKCRMSATRGRICRSRWILTRCPRRNLAKDSPPGRIPSIQTITGDNFNDISNYDGLQASLRKRFSNGLSLDANYTWSKNPVDFDAAGWAGQAGTAQFQKAYSPSAKYGLSNNNVPAGIQGDRLSTSCRLGKEKRFSIPAAASWMHPRRLAGFGNFHQQSGMPFNPVMGTANLSGALSRNSWLSKPDRAHQRSPTPRFSQWFNPSAFAQPASLTFGDSGRNILLGAGIDDAEFLDG